MASLETSERKILKARKTKPGSLCKQVETLSILLRAEPLETANAKGAAPGAGQHPGARVIRGAWRGYGHDAAFMGSGGRSVCHEDLSQPLRMTNCSGPGLDHSEKQASGPHQQPSGAAASPSKAIRQGAEGPPDTSRDCFQCQACVPGPSPEQCEEDCGPEPVCPPTSPPAPNAAHRSNVYSVASCLKIGPGSAGCPGRNQDDVFSPDAQHVPLSTVPMPSSPSRFNGFAADILEREDTYLAYGSSIPHQEHSGPPSPSHTFCICVSTQDRLSPHTAHMLGWWQSYPSIEEQKEAHLDFPVDPIGQSQKKRMFSENKENVKRTRTSEHHDKPICVALEKQTAALEQVRRLIRQEVYSTSYKALENKLEDLTERVGRTHCRREHRAVAEELYTRIARLQRRIKTVLLSQGNCLEPKVLSSNSDCKVINSGARSLLEKQVSTCNNQDKRKTSLSNRPSEKASKRIDLSQDDAYGSESDDVILISEESPHLTTPVTSDPTDSTESVSQNAVDVPTAGTEVRTVTETVDAVIDLTEEPSAGHTGCPMSTQESPAEAVSVSKETDPAAQNAAQGLELLEDLPPLPLQPERPGRALDTLPPQKPELRVRRLPGPRGVTLSWNVSRIDPRCAPVDSYHLFLCAGGPQGRRAWKKVGEVKALPLPMTCSLSQLPSSAECYFTVQSKDVFGRFGPFCDVKSTSGSCENLT